MIAQRIASLREVARMVGQERNFSFALRDFLDGFYADPRLERLAEEPEYLRDVLADQGLADAYLAAVCDHLCRQYRLRRPEWIRSGARILEMPHFSAQSHELRMILLQESPSAFRERNIFVSANALSRA